MMRIIDLDTGWAIDLPISRPISDAISNLGVREYLQQDDDFRGRLLAALTSSLELSLGVHRESAGCPVAEAMAASANALVHHRIEVLQYPATAVLAELELSPIQAYCLLLERVAARHEHTLALLQDAAAHDQWFREQVTQTIDKFAPK